MSSSRRPPRPAPRALVKPLPPSPPPGPAERALHTPLEVELEFELDLERQRLLDVAHQLVQKSRSTNTQRAYRSDWRIFESWCARLNESSLPASPRTVALFIASQVEQQRSPSTIGRRLAAIRLAHVTALQPAPTDAIEVTEVMRGVRRDWNQPPVQKKAALDADIRRMVDAVRQQSARGLRDRALLLVGFAGAFRRSELVALDHAHLEFTERGLKVYIARSKTDQEAQGRTIGIPPIPQSEYCPVQALQDWLTVAEIGDGAVFRRMRPHDKVGATRLSAHSVALIVKEHAERAGLEHAQFSGHSLRRGFLTSAAGKGASIWKMAQRSGHRSLDVLRKYVEEGKLFDDHAGADLLK